MSSLNTAAVRKLARPEVRARRLEEDTIIADVQRMTVRCHQCGWYKRDILVADGKRAFTAHLTGRRHTYWEARQKAPKKKRSGTPQRVLDKHAGRDWGKR